MGAKTSRAIKRTLATLVAVALAAGGAYAFLNRQAINDHFAAQNFDASAEITDLTDQIELTSAGHRIFWATEPTLDASQNFNDRCAKVQHSEEGHILGCYTQDRIHLFNVTDERLDGIVEVTAAHELLHAAFARMSTQDRSALVNRLNDYYAKIEKQDAALAERMQVYRGLSKVGFANELHSVLGTERRELPEWLERHYAQWFEDRAVIIDYFDSYHAIFNELQARATELQEQLEALRSDIETRSATYSSEVERFNTEWNAFVARNNNFEFSDDPDEFYRIRESFYQRRDSLGSEMDRLNADIARYDEMRNELSTLSSLNQELEKQLDSNLAPPAPAPLH